MASLARPSTFRHNPVPHSQPPFLSTHHALDANATRPEYPLVKMHSGATWKQLCCKKHFFSPERCWKNPATVAQPPQLNKHSLEIAITMLRSQNRCSLCNQSMTAVGCIVNKGDGEELKTRFAIPTFNRSKVLPSCTRPSYCTSRSLTDLKSDHVTGTALAAVVGK